VKRSVSQLPRAPEGATEITKKKQNLSTTVLIHNFTTARVLAHAVALLVSGPNREVSGSNLGRGTFYPA
jgi:hypothetical protein